MLPLRIADAALVALLVAAATYDWRTRRIPNWLTFGGMAAGIALASIGDGVGAVRSVLGVLVALSLLLPLYALRISGAGDVKLVAMVGAFLGLPQVLFALLFILVAGGIGAIGFALAHGRMLRMLANTRDLAQLAAVAALNGQAPAATGVASIGRLPYAVCVCAGTLAWLAWAHWRA